MTDVIKKLSDKKIKEGILNLMKDNDNYEKYGEYNLNPQVVKASCDSMLCTGYLNQKEHDEYIHILKKIKEYRDIQVQKNQSEQLENKKRYLNDLIFWS